jgi:anti-repressor protein
MLLFEPGVHKVAIKSQKPEAERLHDFLADEVLPQIARDGRYSPDRTVEGNDVAGGFKLPKSFPEALRLAADSVERAETAEAEASAANREIERMKPAADYGDSLSSAIGARSIGTFAMCLEMNGRRIGQNRLFEFLRSKGVIIKRGRRLNLPTQTYLELGWFIVDTDTFEDENGRKHLNQITLITPKGERGVINLLLNDPEFETLTVHVSGFATSRSIQPINTQTEFRFQG